MSDLPTTAGYVTIRDRGQIDPYHTPTSVGELALLKLASDPTGSTVTLTLSDMLALVEVANG